MGGKGSFVLIISRKWQANTPSSKSQSDVPDSKFQAWHPPRAFLPCLVLIDGHHPVQYCCPRSHRWDTRGHVLLWHQDFGFTFLTENMDLCCSSEFSHLACPLSWLSTTEWPCIKLSQKIFQERECGSGQPLPGVRVSLEGGGHSTSMNLGQRGEAPHDTASPV